MNPFVKSLLVLIAIILAGVVLFFFVRPAVTEWRAMKNLTPEMRDDFEAWYSEPINVYASEIPMKPYSDEFVEEAKKFLSAWNEVADQNFEQSAEIGKTFDAIIDGEDYDSIDLSMYQNVFDVFKTLTQHEDYSSENLYRFSPNEQQSKIIIAVMREVYHLQIIEIQQLIDDGKTSEAMNQFRFLAEAFQPDPYYMIVNSMISDSVAEKLLELAENHETNDLLKNELGNHLEFIEENYFLGEEDKLLIQDHIGIVRHRIKSGMHSGWPPNLSSLTGPELMSMAMGSDSEEITRAVAAQTYAISAPSLEKVSRAKTENHDQVNEIINELE